MTHACTRWRRGATAAVAVGMLAMPVAFGAAFGVPESRTTAVRMDAPRTPSGVTRASPGETRDLTPEVTRRLDAAVRQVMREARVPGVTVGLFTPNRGSYVRSFGVADERSGRRMSPDLYMRIGSETKTFTVTALLQLVDRGVVRLDDPIGRYVDGVPGGDRITLHELAGMRSGLFDYSEDAAFLKALTSDPRRPFTPRELLGYSFSHPVRFPPGERFHYSNTNLVLLGLVVEKASGLPLGDFIRRNILAPAGLNHTLFPDGATFPDPHAQGYTNQTAAGKTEDAADWNPSWRWAAGAMISDLRDLRVWARTLATGRLSGGGALISPALQGERLSTPPTPFPGVGYGLGVFTVRGWIGHNGALPGYESLVVHLPSARTTLVVLLNTDIDHGGRASSTLFGEAITKIATPGHVFTLPAQPATG